MQGSQLVFSSAKSLILLTRNDGRAPQMYSRSAISQTEV